MMAAIRIGNFVSRVATHDVSANNHQHNEYREA